MRRILETLWYVVKGAGIAIFCIIVAMLCAFEILGRLSTWLRRTHSTPKGGA